MNKIILLGIFDGVHIGHAALIDAALELKRETGLPIVMYTFSSNPKSSRLIHTDERKAAVAADMGVDEVYFEEFTQDIKEMLCEDFVRKILDEKLLAKYVIVGENYRFGYNRAGSARRLKTICARRGIEVVIVPTVKRVSSSRIRNMIEGGRIEDANKLLSREFCVTGTVAHGSKVGRILGFCTANLPLPPGGVIPKSGVYFTNAEIGGARYDSITNVGTKPTFGGNGITAETHIFDFDKELYGQTITVYFLKCAREERRFNSADELKAQINRDMRRAKIYFEGRK